MAGGNVEFRRLDEDTRIVNGMGRFYAAKLRAARLYEIWLGTGDPQAGVQALAQYEKGRAAWSALAERARAVYVSDISYGRVSKRRGHWTDAAPEAFRPGVALDLALAVPGEGITARLFYRHVNQAGRWRYLAMQRWGEGFTAAIPGDYAASPFPLQYYFELSRGDAAWLYPAFNATLSNQPYYAVWKRRA